MGFDLQGPVDIPFLGLPMRLVFMWKYRHEATTNTFRVFVELPLCPFTQVHRIFCGALDVIPT